MFTAQNIIDFAVRLEKNGETIYRNAQGLTSDAAMGELLEWAAEEERKHGEWFAALREEIDADEDHHLIEDMNKALVSEYFQDQSFSLKEVDFSKIESTEEMIEVFIEFEEDTILFYQMLESFTSDEETAKRLTQIIEEEQNHIQKLQTLLTKPSYTSTKKP